MSIAKRIAKAVRRLPVHPQWLLGARKPSRTIATLRGIVVDVGCADRWVELHLGAGTTYVGLDYPPTGSRLYSAQPDVLADAASLPFKASSVDAIICLEVLEHTRNHQAALREFARVLRPRGTLVLSMPFMYPIHDAPHDYQRLTEHGLRRDMASAGFDVVRLDKVGTSIRTAGVMYNLALVGGIHSKGRAINFALLPFAAILVFVINLVSLVFSWILPDWSALCFGYEVDAVKS